MLNARNPTFQGRGGDWTSGESNFYLNLFVSSFIDNVAYVN